VVAGWLVGRFDVPAGLVDVDADEVQGRGDDLQLVLGEPRSPPAGRGEVLVGVAALQQHGHEAGVPVAGGGFGGPDVFGDVQDRDGHADVLREPDLRAGRCLGADRLDGEAVAEDGVVAHLLELRVGKGEPGGGAEVYGPHAPDRPEDLSAAAFDEGGQLVDPEVVDLTSDEYT